MKKLEFIVELSKLRKKPCYVWLNRFKGAKIDAYQAFKIWGQKYEWLYANSDYDIIGWEIENNVFDWKKYSPAVAMFCAQHFDAEKYDWECFSLYVVKCCPQHFDAEKYDWKLSEKQVAYYCPEYLHLKPKNK